MARSELSCVCSAAASLEHWQRSSANLDEVRGLCRDAANAQCAQRGVMYHGAMFAPCTPFCDGILPLGDVGGTHPAKLKLLKLNGVR